MAAYLTYERPGVYRLREEAVMEHVSVSVALLTDVYDVLAKAIDQGEAQQFHTVCCWIDSARAVEPRLGLVLDHVRAQRRKEEDPYPPQSEVGAGEEAVT
jgi:hypothetical protein